QRENFRGSMSRLSISLSTLRRLGRPTTTQDSLPAAGQLYRAGFGPAGFRRKVSELYSLHLIPLPQASPGAMTPFATKWKRCNPTRVVATYLVNPSVATP